MTKMFRLHLFISMILKLGIHLDFDERVRPIEAHFNSYEYISNPLSVSPQGACCIENAAANKDAPLFFLLNILMMMPCRLLICIPTVPSPERVSLDQALKRQIVFLLLLNVKYWVETLIDITEIIIRCNEKFPLNNLLKDLIILCNAKYEDTGYWNEEWSQAIIANCLSIYLFVYLYHSLLLTGPLV